MEDKNPTSSNFSVRATVADMVTVSTPIAEQILRIFAKIEPEHADTFSERLKQLRRFGVPTGVAKGRGVRTGRTLEQMLQLALALRLLEAGLASVAVAEMIEKGWQLASAVLTYFDRAEFQMEGAAVLPQDAYWVAVPRALSDYRGQGADRAVLETLILTGPEELGPKLAAMGETVVVVRARMVIATLFDAYAAAGVADQAALRSAVRELRLGAVISAREEMTRRRAKPS
jgi:hypothetical protein